MKDIKISIKKIIVADKYGYLVKTANGKMTENINRILKIA